MKRLILILIGMCLTLLLVACAPTTEAPVATAEPEVAAVEAIATDPPAVVAAEPAAIAAIPEAERAEALLTAVREDDLSTATQLLEANVDIETRGYFEMTPLLIATLRGNQEMVNALLAAGSDPMAEDQEGKNGVTLAVLSNKIDLVQQMIDLGVPVSNINDGPKNPLMQAAKLGSVEIGRLLIANGADIYAVDAYGDPPLAFAAYYDQPAFAQMLIEEYGMNPNVRGYGNNTALDYAINQDKEKVVAYLMEVTAADPDAALNEDLFTAVRQDDITTTQRLLKFGANVNGEDPVGFLRLSPIQVAVLRGNTDMVHALIELGADPHAVDSGGDTLLFHAVTSGNPAMVKLFLDQGLEVNIVTSEFASGPLSVAARDGSVEIGELLIEYGADLEMPDQNGDPPFNSAAYFGQLEFIKMLIEHGAKIDSVSDFGQNALTYAESQGFPQVANFLREQGVTEPETQDESAQKN